MFRPGTARRAPGYLRSRWMGRAEFGTVPRAGSLDGVVDLTHRLSGEFSFAVDRSLVLRYVSPSAHQLFGPELLPRIGEPLSAALLHPDDHERIRAEWACIGAGGVPGPHRARLVQADGGFRWMQFDFIAAGESMVAKRVRVFEGVVGVARDITEQVNAEERSRRAAERLAALGHSSTEFAVVAGPDGAVRWVGPAVERVLGYAPAARPGRAMELVHVEDRAMVVADLAFLKAAPAESSVGPSRCRVRDASGAYRWMEYVATCRHDQAGAAVIATLRDVSAQVAAELANRHLVEHDDLTGLLARRTLVARLGAHGEPAPGCIRVALWCDLDDFAAVNDNLGEELGDEVLRAVALRLAALAESVGGLCARMAGDAFLVVAVVAEGDADAFAARVVSAVRDRTAPPSSGIAVTVSASVGLAAQDPGEPVERFVERSRVACAAANRAGGDRVGRFDAAIAERERDERQLRADLRVLVGSAVGSDPGRAAEQFVVHYQPEVDLTDGRVVGAEALVRWDHPQRGFLSAGAFVPAAERSGSIVGITRFVLRQAAADFLAWKQAGLLPDGFRMRLNLSAADFLSADLVDIVTAATTTGGLRPAQWCLELTESTMLETDRVRAQVARFTALGYAIELDDFGTGYSSLAYLASFDVAGLKIDRTFVADMATEPRAHLLVDSICALAGAMHLALTSEGIETEDQVRVLRAKGCTVGQGFLFSPAVPAPVLADQLRRPFAVPADA
jgi:diguanylate cyclase (GGDEF)-like protein/PAS domain S-box-containing protein